jgi:hypothetical protein
MPGKLAVLTSAVIPKSTRILLKRDMRELLSDML